LELDHFFLDAYIGRGNVFLDFGTDMGRLFAGYDYQRCLVLKPMYLAARVNLAYNLQMHGKFMQAWQQFTIAIEQDACKLSLIVLFPYCAVDGLSFLKDV
jgi:hypothetical protein